MSEREKIEQAMAALEAQRGLLGDHVVQTAIAALTANLLALDAEDEKRSLVTVLFADLSGFTSLSERLDAEELQDIMGEFWAGLDQTILSHGGEIDKHMGDRVLAVWGLTQAHEEDPEQAVRAALAICARVAAFRQEHDSAVHIRLGINTGLASVGHISSTGERNIIGDTVNLAARLEKLAPNDSILIAQPTYHQVRGLFECEAQQPIHVKGKTAPVQSYLVLRAQARAFEMPTRGLVGVTTRTVGREAELSLLQNTFHQVQAGRGLGWVTLWGEAGVGKSRLLSDFEGWARSLPEELVLVKARAWPQTTHSPYHLLRSVLASRWQIGDSDPLAIAREKLAAGMVAALGPETGEQAAALIGHLIGFDLSQSQWISTYRNDSKQIQLQAEIILQRHMGKMLADGVCVILLEDLQWADEQSLSLLSAILSEHHPWRLMVVGAARPALWERRARWGPDVVHHHLVELGVLRGPQAGELVDELLQKVSQPPEWLTDLLVERGGGNPYFTEELVKWLVEQGLIQVSPAGWRAHLDEPRGLIVPGTVQGVLQTRIERLGRQERAILQQAAVVGPVFWRGAVESVGEAPIQPELWRELERRNLILAQPASQLPGEDEYHFKHALLRDVAYEYTLRKQRQVYHQRAAQWLSAVAAERANEWAAVIANHYQQAGDRDPAAAWYRRAGKQARDVFEIETAVDYYRHALALLPHPIHHPETAAKSGERLQLFQGLGEMLRLLARFDEAAEAFIGMLVTAQACADPVLQTHGWRRAFLSLEDAKAALALDITKTEFNNSEESRRLTALELNLLGAMYRLLGCQGEVDPYIESTLSLLSEFDVQLERDTAGTLPLCDEGVAIADRIGNLGGRMLCLTHLGRARARAGDPEAGIAHLREVIRLSDQTEWYGIAETHRLLAETLLEAGRTAEAQAGANEALTWARRVGQPAFVGRAWRTLGEVTGQAGAPVTVDGVAHDARSCFKNSEQLFKEGGSRAERALTLEKWAAYELAHGDRQGGEAMQLKAHAMLAQLGIQPSGRDRRPLDPAGGRRPLP
jgi:class 3 adenylate cyclase/tetratricopeptide (TPR) repeat protein